MSHYWERFLKEGDELFNYMINNFEKMFEDNMHINHFEIRDGFYASDKSKELIDINYYNNEIEKDLIIFIRKEVKTKSLFNKSNWKPFRFNMRISEMYYSYNKLFKFKKYYFQLSIDQYCEINNCKCHENNENNEDNCNPHFMIALYGWKDDISNIMLPYNNIFDNCNNIIPDSHWNRN